MLDANLGTIGVWLAFVACLAGIVVSIVGLLPRRRMAGEGEAPSASARPGTDARLLAPVMCIGALFAAGAMEHALVTHDFTLVFVAQNNSTVTPLLYSITGMWSALAGSILLWGLDPLGGVDHLRVAVPPPGGGLGHPLCHARPLRRLRLLLRADDRPGQPLHHRAGRDAGLGPTRCSRTTRWWPSTRRCSTSASSSSPCPSPSPSACWRRGGWGTAGRLSAGAGRWSPSPSCRSALCWGLVVVPGARMGRVLGVGPGRERRTPALALRDGLSALHAGPGTARPRCASGTSPCRSPPSP